MKLDPCFVKSWSTSGDADTSDSFIFTGRISGIAVDPNNPNVDDLPGTPGPDDLAGLPAVQADVDGRDFLLWQRGNSPDVDAGTLDLV